MSGVKQTASWILKGAVTFGLLCYIFVTVPLAQVLRVIGSANGLDVALGCLLMVLARAVGSCRTKLLTDKQGMSLSMRQIFEIHCATTFYGIFLPGSLAGGLIRWHKLARQDRKAAEAVTVIVFDRMADTIALVAVGGICWLFGTPTAPSHEAVGLSFLIMLGGLLALYILVFRSGVAKRRLRQLEPHRWSWVPAPIRTMLAEAIVSASQYQRLSGRFLAGVAGLSVGSHLLGVASFCFLGRSLGLQVSWLDLGWIRSGIMLVAMLPIAIAGFGVREGGLILFLQPYGVPGTAAVALSFLRFASGLVVAAVGGVLELKRLFAPRHGRVAVSEPFA